MPLTTSWDDGHPTDLRLADRLARHGIPATFYVPQRNLEGLPVMSAAQLRELDGPFEIGSHTFDHAYADRTALPTWADSMQRGKAALEQALGHPVEGFCFPGGQRHRGAIAAVASAGFRWARTVLGMCLDAGDDPYSMPTTLQMYPHGRSVLMRNAISGGQWMHRWPIAIRMLHEPDWTRRSIHLLEATAESGGVIHFWGHSWEIDRHDLWGGLDMVLAEASRLFPSGERITNGQLADRVYSARSGPP